MNKKNFIKRNQFLGSAALVGFSSTMLAYSKEAKGDMTPVNRAFITGDEQGFVELTEADFKNVNCSKDTWSWKGSTVYCTGKPIGVIRSNEQYTNFEMVCQWRHLSLAGNSGIFVWTPKDVIDNMTAAARPGLPRGIEVQVLDLGYTEHYIKTYKKPANWFTCHGDVFPVGVKMKPFPPVAPNKKRSFPSKNLSRPREQWNHYYIRAINGEVRLWVNGEEVSGGNNCDPKKGYICLESEGAPVEFRNIRVRKLA